MESLIDNIIKRRENMKLKERGIDIIERKSDSINNEDENKNEKEDTKKCSFDEHEDKEAIKYCYNCQVYLCDKCVEHHKVIFANHIICSIDEINNETFTGLCKENNHNIKLEYYCKTHNKLCCGLCICKIKGNGNGEHNDCDIYLIKDIKAEKKRKIKDNINELEKSIKDLKLNLDKEKDKLKSDIKNTFDKIRVKLNDREDILLSNVDKYFNDNFYYENIIKKDNEFKSLLDNNELMNNNLENDYKLNEFIYNCINIEKKLKDINLIKEKIEEKHKTEKFNIKFNNNINNLFIYIDKFGCLSNFESLILNDEYNIKKFNKLILKDRVADNMNLLYRSSRDGLKYLNIIKAINNKSNLIFLYLTENDRIFGAYIKTKLENININGSKKYYKDENAFVFSINNNKKYKILISEYAISFDNKNYILIGNKNNNGFYYSDNIINDKQLINGDKIYDFSENSELTEGSGKLIELEIFEIN